MFVDILLFFVLGCREIREEIEKNDFMNCLEMCDWSGVDFFFFGYE